MSLYPFCRPPTPPCPTVSPESVVELMVELAAFCDRGETYKASIAMTDLRTAINLYALYHFDHMNSHASQPPAAVTVAPHNPFPAEDA